LEEEKPAIFGLQGMRECAGRIGGKLSLVSSARAGTEVKLVVPGQHHLPAVLRRKRAPGYAQGVFQTATPRVIDPISRYRVQTDTFWNTELE
jgi:hypothetical protein